MNYRVLWSSFLVSLAILLSLVVSVQADGPRNEDAIRDVLQGKCKVAHAAWWGYDAKEATAALQAAIDSGAEKVIVEKMSGPWIVDKINLADNQELFFEPGVVVEAKKGAFRGKADALLSAWNKSNIKLVGPGATLRMHRADYDSPDYEKAEWRHVLNFHGCTDVTVLGLTLAESGGDGIYLGTGRDGATNRNVTIRDVICDRNYRQGISVITAENLLIEDCVLKNTGGTAPQAGIDFEPNRPSERLVNCVMRNCLIADNKGLGIHLYLRPLDGTSEPVSIRIENCTTRGTNVGSASVVTSCGPEGPVQGSVEFVNCRFEDEGRAGIRIGSKPPTGLRLRFIDCPLADPSEEPAVSSPISFSTRRGDLQPTGGFEFVNLTVRERVDRPLMRFADVIGANLLDIKGNIVIHRDGNTVEHELTREVLDQWVPFDEVLECPAVELDGLRLEPAVASQPATTPTKLPHHRLRGRALYLFHAAKGDVVILRLRHRAVGPKRGDGMSVHAVSSTGKQFPEVAVPLDDEAEYTFTADATGAFALHCDPDWHTVQVVSATHPLCIAGKEGRIHLLGTTGDFYFWVPGEAEQFGMRFQGAGDGERLSATVFDAKGAARWQKADIGFPESFVARRKPTEQGEIWRVEITRPSVGVLEDGHIVLRGIPSLFSLTPEGLLRPAAK